MVFYLYKVILVCLCAVMTLSLSMVFAQTSPGSDQIKKETKSTIQIKKETKSTIQTEPQQKKPPWQKVKGEPRHQETQSKPKKISEPEKKPEPKK